MKSLVIGVAALVVFSLRAHGQGSVIVRVDDPSGSHCIDATTEEVTVHMRRVFLEKTQGLFTTDNHAGVVVSAKVTGQSHASTVEVHMPSVNLVEVKGQPAGRLSLPLEYAIASSLPLKQDEVTTTEIALSLSLAKTRSRNSFGELLDLAGKALNKLPIPANPFEQTANKFLTFTNDAISATTAREWTVPFAEVALSFNNGQEADLNRCKSEGKERTGVIAVLLAQGLPNSELVPVSNTDELYCFRYSSANTYELLAAKKTDGQCPAPGAFRAVNNDYVMLIISAHAGSSGFTTQSERQSQIEESNNRCARLGLEPEACGVPR